jgi:sigma-B regulation protein RsbU (phosphoserine phosphatase)
VIIPARAVGGDFYDFIPVDKHRLCIVIGDISDKGLPAALFMAVTFSLVRAETGRSDNQRQILDNINKFLLKMNAKMFVTLLYCILDLRTGTMQYSRAGHLPPIVVDGDGNIVEIPVTDGQPLGVLDNMRIDQGQFTIPDGGLALLFSDGLNEAVDSQGNVFGMARVKNELLAFRGENAKKICENLWKSVRKHSGEVPHQDDFTTVIIKRGQN